MYDRFLLMICLILDTNLALHDLNLLTFMVKFGLSDKNVDWPKDWLLLKSKKPSILT